MKKLFLLRHAKSSWKYPELDDFERPLNKRGRTDAPKMGRRLKERAIRPDIILSSPANRAAMTARIIAEIIGFPLSQILYLDHIYDGGPAELKNVISQIDNRHKEAFLVGHNPGLTLLANRLGDRHVSNISTCGIYALNLDIEEWKTVADKSGFCLFHESPKGQT